MAIFASWSEMLTKSYGNIVNKNPHIAAYPHKNWYVCTDERNFESARNKNVALPFRNQHWFHYGVTSSLL